MLAWQEVGANAASVELIDAAVSPGRHWYCETVEGAEAYPKAPTVAHAPASEASPQTCLP